MITIRLTTSTQLLTAQFGTPGGDIAIDFQMCQYCGQQPVQLPQKFCSDNHRVTYWKKQIAGKETSPVTRQSSVLLQTPA